jgi:enterochelin esterase-like enzyme
MQLLSSPAYGRFFTFVLSLLISSQLFAQGTLETITVHSPALEGNLAGESADREVFVYLPPSYTDSSERYPVIIFLHGYAVGAGVYVNGVLNMPGAADEAIASGAEEFIIVMPDAFTTFGGSMYSNSPTIGDWETWIAEDLVSYIDENYRTIGTPGSRGLSGHSMGGYGTLRVGMKKPGAFAALYAMSSCCVMNNPPPEGAIEGQLADAMGNGPAGPGSFGSNFLAQAAAWAPNPQNPPYYLDSPYQNGETDPVIQAKWPANSPLVFIDQYVHILKQYRALFLDVGDEDSLVTTNTQLSAKMEELGLEHSYEIYEGTHGNRVGERFMADGLSFFAEHLDR